MSTKLLFYANARPVYPKEHRDLCVKMGSDYSFARNVSAVPLTTAEFAQAAREYPIVFAGRWKAPAVSPGESADHR